MYDSLSHTQIAQPVIVPNDATGVLPPIATNDSVFPYKGIEQGQWVAWLISPRSAVADTLTSEELTASPRNTLHPIAEAFYPPLPGRTWAEKQYSPTPMKDSLLAQMTPNAVSFSFFLIALVLSIYLRFRFWKYYTAYAKLLFHPRSLPRVNEVEGPHLTQFHTLVDFTNLFSLASILFNVLRILFPSYHIIELPSHWLLLVVFTLLLLYYLYRYIVLYTSCNLIKEPRTASILWRQYFFVHRLLWPYYLSLAFLSSFSTAPLCHYVTYLGLGLIPLVTLYSQIRVLLTFLYFHYNLFYYFLYLCMLGIAPWLGLVRWLQLV